uniref:Neurogenic mastermind-like N-terminal domain-containing protein n=1 Tax=Gasterosteus aculeatus aculeatus TaxID=481459 RepID=A0AAQ4PUM4_GASAC
MGEATPAQSAAGAFAPMLGVGLGTMPAGVGNGPVGATSRGSAVPQLHSAIVERLRARIELCRRHHSTCENRYQRGQAESSDREHDSTLHLLNIVHQGPGNRKTKGGRGSNQQPPEYSRANGEPKGAEGEQKISTRIAGVAPGPRLPTNGNLGMSTQSQPRVPVPNNQQKGAVKSQAMQRPLNQQQHSISNSDKDNVHDQFNRHLTRPPPDYKQSRGMVGAQQGNIFTGQNPSQSSSNGTENDIQSMSCHLPSGSGSKITPSDRRYGIGTECRPSSCIGQVQQHNNQNRIGLNQNKARFLGPNTHANSFGMNNVAGVQHPRTTADLHSSGLPGHGLGGLMKNVNMGWGSANKQVTTGLGIRRLPNPLQSPGAQLDMSNLPYQQRFVGPPNQVAPDIGMLPLNPLIRDTGPRLSQPMMGSPSAVGNLNQASPEQRVPAGHFAEPSPSSSSYQNNRANRLTFDFLPEGDNTVPGINTDSDFIDSLLKSGSGNDDWMKDINLDEILGSHS